METSNGFKDFFGNVLTAGDAVVVSERGQLVVGIVSNFSPKRVIITLLHADEMSRTRGEYSCNVIKIVDPAYHAAPVEWLKVMFPAAQ